MLKIAADKKKEKSDAANQLAKIRAQIAEDRKNKAAKFDTESAAENEAKEAKKREITEEKLRAEREQLEEERKLKDTMARIQVFISQVKRHCKFKMLV